MTMHETMRDPERDPRLAALLREAAGEPALDDEAFARMRGSIGAAAEMPLARMRGGRRRGWMRIAVPVTAAAGLGAMLVLGGRAISDGGRVSAEEQAVIDAIVEASIPPRVDLAISGELQDELLLEAAVGS